MKLPMPTGQEILSIAERAEQAVYMCDGNRAATKLIVENAIRHALQVVVDRLNIDVAPIRLDLGKQG